jgi:hypothetical protein
MSREYQRLSCPNQEILYLHHLGKLFRKAETDVRMVYVIGDQALELTRVPVT